MKGGECFGELWQAMEAIRQHLLMGQERKGSVDEEVGVLLGEGEKDGSIVRHSEYTPTARC